MKKFIGLVLIFFGALWTFISFDIFKANDGVELFASIFVTGIGVVTIFLGIKLLIGKKKNKQYSESTHTVKRYSQSKTRSSSPYEEPLDSKSLKLKEIRILAAQKFNSIDSSEYRLSAAELSQTFYSLNDSQLPFEFQESTQQGVDLIGHWKLADAEYLGVLGLNNHDIQEQFDVLMKFDEPNRTIHCKDKLYRKESSFGIGGMGMEMSTFSGKSTSVKKEFVFGRKKDGTIGKVVDISLDTSILHNAIKVVAKKSKWKVKRVVGKL